MRQVSCYSSAHQRTLKEPYRNSKELDMTLLILFMQLSFRVVTNIFAYSQKLLIILYKYQAILVIPYHVKRDHKLTIYFTNKLLIVIYV